MTTILTSRDRPSLFLADGGGKAANLARITQHGLRVPPWFCLSARAFDAFVNQHGLHDRLTLAGDRGQFARQVEELFLSKSLPAQVEEELFRMIETMNLGESLSRNSLKRHRRRFAHRLLCRPALFVPLSEGR